MRYVLGFVFNKSKTMTKFIFKNGKLNGFGGKCLDHEKISSGMARKFKCELDIDTKPEDWTLFGDIISEGCVVNCFYIVDDKIFKDIFPQNNIDDKPSINKWVTPFTIRDMYLSDRKAFADHVITLISAALEDDDNSSFITITVDD